MWIKAREYADMKSELAALKAQVESLKAEVAWATAAMSTLEDTAKEERARTDAAVDRLLAHSGVAPVSRHEVPDRDDILSLFEEDPAEVRKIEQAIKDRGAAEVVLEGV